MLLDEALTLVLILFRKLSDMLSTMAQALCIVLNRGSLGDELVVLENMKVDLYKFVTGLWRHGSSTTQVSWGGSVIP